MTLGTLAAFVLALLGLVVAIAFCVNAARHLARVRRTPPLPAPTDARDADPADDVPTMRFKGEPFESRWQGSRGYERPDELWERASKNWTDYVLVSVITPLRPSRFSDAEYWTRYLPRVLGLKALFFLLVPLLFITLSTPASGTVGTFFPTQAQRDVPVHNTAFVTDPAACANSSNAAPTSNPPVFVNYVDDGIVFSLRPGGLVAISYYYGKPVFSPDVPLCVSTTATSADKTGFVEYQVADSGTGYIYIPQPNGTVVAEIEVAPDYSTLVYIILGVTAATFCFGFVVLVRLRRETRARFTVPR